MSYQYIEEGINVINSVTSWSLALIEYNHKTHPGEYTCYSLGFQSDELLKSTITDMSGYFLNIIQTNDQMVQEYTGTNSKNVVDRLSVSNDLVKTQWKNLLSSLNECDDNKSLVDIKSNAYIFAGTYSQDGKDRNIYLLSRKNPVYTYKKGKGKIFESRHNKITEISEPLIQFGKTYDVLIYRDVIYSLNNNFESIFNMEYSHRVICKSSLEIIKKASIIKNYENYEKFALSGQHPRKFISFDKGIVDNIRRKENLDIIVLELKIPYDKNVMKFDLTDISHAELFTKAICNKTKHDMFSDGLCEVPNSIPLNL